MMVGEMMIGSMLLSDRHLVKRNSHRATSDGEEGDRMGWNFPGAEFKGTARRIPKFLNKRCTLTMAA